MSWNKFQSFQALDMLDVLAGKQEQYMGHIGISCTHMSAIRRKNFHFLSSYFCCADINPIHSISTHKRNGRIN